MNQGTSAIFGTLLGDEASPKKFTTAKELSLMETKYCGESYKHQSHTYIGHDAESNSIASFECPGVG